MSQLKRGDLFMIINNGENPSEIIRKYTNINNNFTIEYADGSVSSYYCSSEDHEDKIRDTMLNRAYNLQKLENIKNTKLKRDANLFISLMSGLLTLALANKGFLILASIMLLVEIFSIYKKRECDTKLKELKKYKLFFELLPHLDEINKSDFLKCIEFDNFYQVPLDINTLYEYSYGDVKALHKEYKKKHLKK